MLLMLDINVSSFYMCYSIDTYIDNFHSLKLHLRFNGFTVTLMPNFQRSVRVTDIIIPAGIHFLCIALRYNKPDKSKTHKNIPFITFL